MEDKFGAASPTWNTALKVELDREVWRALADAPCATRHKGIN